MKKETYIGSPLYFCRFSPNGRCLAVSGENTLKVSAVFGTAEHNIPWYFVYIVPSHPTSIEHQSHSLAFSPDSKFLAVAVHKDIMIYEMLDMAPPANPTPVRGGHRGGRSPLPAPTPNVQRQSG